MLLNPNRHPPSGEADGCARSKERTMNQIIYIVGAIVIVIALLSFVGLR